MDSKAGRANISEFQTPAPTGVNWLLVIAIDKYDPAIGKLYNCVRDAQDFRNTLWERYHFDKSNTVELYNEQATKDAILESFDDLMEKINKDTRPANLIFYYSGHGELMHSRGYWLPADAQKNRRGSYLPNEEVTHFIKNLSNARHVLGIVDACFAGTLFTERNASDTWQRFYNIPSRCIMTAGRNEVVIDGIPGFNSPFAKSLLTQLEANTSSELSATMLWESMKEGVVSNSKQTPRYEPVQDVGHLGGEFYFHLKRDEVRDWEVAQQQNTILAYTNFRRNHPKGIYYQEARQKIRDLEEEEDWQKALRRDKVSDYEDYLEEYPNGKYVAEAHQNIDAILKSTQVKTTAPKIILPEKPKLETPLLSFEPEMIFVQGGTFKMGSNEKKKEQPIHEVTIQDFYLGIYPVTFAEYDAFCEATKREKPKDEGWGRDKRPVINTSWHDAKDYCNWLNKETNKLPFSREVKYRLPTEAEWEYSARGGRNSLFLGEGKANIGFKYAGSNNLDEIGWFLENSNNSTHLVGSKKPNELGIYDMSGNVWEWNEDHWYDSYKGAPTNGSAWVRVKGYDSYRVIRGGSWNVIDQLCQVSFRSRIYSSYGYNFLGFRLAKDV